MFIWLANQHSFCRNIRSLPQRWSGIVRTHLHCTCSGPFSSLEALLPLIPTLIWSAHLVFQYNPVPRNVCGVVIAMWLYVPCYLYAKWTPQQRWTSRRRHTCWSVCGFSSDSSSGTAVLFLCSRFPRSWISKMAGDTHDSLSDATAAWRRHILVAAQITWTPCQAGTKK